MERTFHHHRTDLFRLVLVLTCAGLSLNAYAQITPEEHASHHPGKAVGGSPSATPGSAGGMGRGMGGKPGMAGPPEGVGGGPPDGAGGMMGGGGMGGMMEQMGAPKPKEMYPKLMDLPDLPMEERAAIEQESHQRMTDGAKLLSQGLDELTNSAPSDDFDAMQAATAKMREGLARFESGLAAHRAIAEGQAPRNVALQWFKREMNLANPMPSDEPRALPGATPFHLFSMVLLLLFALAMVALYFVKMRRACSARWANRGQQGRTATRIGAGACRISATACSQRREGSFNVSKQTTKKLAARKRPQSVGSRRSSAARGCEMERIPARRERCAGNAERQNDSPAACVR